MTKIKVITNPNAHCAACNSDKKLYELYDKILCTECLKELFPSLIIDLDDEALRVLYENRHYDSQVSFQ